MPEEIPFDRLFIGEETDSQDARNEEWARIAVALNRHSGSNRETSSFVKDTRNVLKKVNGQPFGKDVEVDEEDTDELNLEGEFDVVDPEETNEDEEPSTPIANRLKEIASDPVDMVALDSELVPDSYGQYT